MSAHYSSRKPSGCCGCIAALAFTVGMIGITAYVCWEFATFVTGGFR